MRKTFWPVAFVAAVLIGHLTPSCARSDNTEAQSDLRRVPAVSSGTLYLWPYEAFGLKVITGGIVQYTIYANGAVTYHGDVSFMDQENKFDELQKRFSGEYFIHPRTIRAETYQEVSAVNIENKVSTIVKKVEDGIAYIRGEVADPTKTDLPDGTGTVMARIDAGPYVEIIEANISGTAFVNTPIATFLKLRLTKYPPTE